jgi:hypothetical protein
MAVIPIETQVTGAQRLVFPTQEGHVVVNARTGEAFECDSHEEANDLAAKHDQETAEWLENEAKREALEAGVAKEALARALGRAQDAVAAAQVTP